MYSEQENKNTTACMFSQRLRELRQSTGLTQTQFAEKVGLSKTAMTNYENIGKNPSLETAFNIAKTFNVSLDWLCGIDDKQREKFEIKTCGDAIRLIYVLLTTGCFVVESLEDSNFMSIAPKRGTYGRFMVKSWFDLFMRDYEKLNSLRLSGTVTQEIFGLWLNGALEKLDSQPLTIPINDIQEIEEDDDGEVPF